MKQPFELLQTLTEYETSKTECFASRGHSFRKLQRPTDLNLWILQIFAGVNLVYSNTGQPKSTAN